MNQPKLTQCGECLYFRLNTPKDKDKALDQQRGTCHRYPPREKDSFPHVTGEDFCGKSKAGESPFNKTPGKVWTGKI